MDAERLIEELRIHQLELELQNEDLRKARVEAERARDRYLVLFDTAPIPYVVVDGSGTIKQANIRAGEMFGAGRGKLRGRKLHPLFVSEDISELKHLLSAAQQGYAAGRKTLAVKGSESGEQFIEVSVAQWDSDETEDEPGVLVALVDVTERKLREDAETRSAFHYRRLLREMTHRIKNNLQILTSIIELERKGGATDRSFAKMAERVRNVSRVHNALYDAATDVDEVDLGQTIHGFVQQFSESLPPHIHLAFDPPEEPIRFDSRTALSVSLVVNELLTNALQHAFPDGRSGKVTVTMTLREEDSIIVIADNGVGMSRDQRHPDEGSVGTQLVMQLLGEVGGEWDTRTQDGLRHEIRLPRP
jgi:PAS domain S-box-containing protein